MSKKKPRLSGGVFAAGLVLRLVGFCEQKDYVIKDRCSLLG